MIRLTLNDAQKKELQALNNSLRAALVGGAKPSTTKPTRKK